MNKKELADKIGISRATLYNRAKAFSIDLNIELTPEQIEALQTNIPVKKDTKVEILQPKNEKKEDKVSNDLDTLSRHSLDTFRHLSRQNEQLSEQINKLFEQLSAKDKQLESKDLQLNSAQKLIDQAQQLQLDLQQQLAQSEQNKSQLLIENKELSEHLQEKNKTFWQKLFRFD